MHILDNTWYHGFIAEHAPSHNEEDTPQSHATKSLAFANLAAACVIAQAIDGLTNAIKRDNYGSFKDLEYSIDELCRVLDPDRPKPQPRLIVGTESNGR
jgi:hypothetical protein